MAHKCKDHNEVKEKADSKCKGHNEAKENKAPVAVNLECKVLRIVKRWDVCVKILNLENACEIA